MVNKNIGVNALLDKFCMCDNLRQKGGVTRNARQSNSLFYLRPTLLVIGARQK